MNYERIYKKIIHSKNLLLIPLHFLLWLCSFIYKSLLFIKFNRITQRIINKKVISIGNITTGGTGKTSFVIYLAEILKKQFKLIILSRGYKRKAKGLGILFRNNASLIYGDEPYLLHKKTGLPVIVHNNRYEAANYAISRFNPDLFILDDGYQHWQIARDVDILLIDATSPFDNNFLLPRGLLREPISSLKRADIVVITRVNQAKDINRIKKIVRKYNPYCKIFECEIIFQGIYQNRKKVSVKKLKNKRLLCFAGIGNYYSFEKIIKENLIGFRVDFLEFPDHIHYSAPVVNRLKKYLKIYDYLITTEKDYIKLKHQNILFVRIKFQIKRNVREFFRLIFQLIGKFR